MDIIAALDDYLEQTKTIRKTHYLPELSAGKDEVLTLYSTAITLRDEAIIAEFAVQNSKGDSATGFDIMVQTIIHKLVTEDGKKVFNPSMHDKIAQLPEGLIKRLLNDISQRPTLEEHEKNSLKTDTSD